MSGGPSQPGGDDRPVALHAIRHTADEIDGITRAIRDRMLATSRSIRTPDFRFLAESDLRALFEAYDADVFGGMLGRFLREDGVGSVGFRLSSRMTAAAGKTFFRRRRIRAGGAVVERREYEIAVSTTILFASFKVPGRPMKVGGRPCHDRLEALQRIVEHEALHLAEFLAWGRSNCSAPNFRDLSRSIFGHEASNHELMTPTQEAAETLGIRPGDPVAFAFEGQLHRGIVNRITRRATVLVPDPGGERFSDGKTYRRFYVPVELLRKDPS